MKYVIKKSKHKPVKLFPIRKSEFTETVEHQSEYVQNYVKSSRQKGDLGDIFSIRNPDGIIEEVLYVIDDTINIWSFACLPKKLPEGDYEIHGDFNKKESTDIAAGWEIGTYKFDKYKEIKNGYARLVVPKNADIEEAQNVAEATFLVRNLINTPTCDMGTKELAQAAIDIAHKYKCSYNVISDSELLDEGYNSIYTVGKASTKRPCLVDIQWGDPDDAKITIVGKGVCFDTGGLNLKGESNMLLMKKDMGGAAIALGLSKMIMQSKLNVSLRLLLPIVENSVSGEAMRPSDVIRTRAGITVEVTNTDAEGRLVLCEPLAEADSETPDLLIDFATLTGAARTAVGTEVAAYFSTDDKLAEEMEKCSREVHDPIWRLPLWDGYKPMIKSKVADLVNSPESGNGGAITAALFLKEFVKKTKKWIHFDLMAWNNRERAGRPVGGEAMAMRAVYAYLKKKYS